MQIVDKFEAAVFFDGYSRNYLLYICQQLTAVTMRCTNQFTIKSPLKIHDNSIYYQIQNTLKLEGVLISKKCLPNATFFLNCN